MDLQMIIIQLIGLLSLLVGQTLPDTLPQDKVDLLQQIVPNLYAGTKFALPPIVAKTPNIIDDATVIEIAEICEILKSKYGIVLNPEAVNLNQLLKKA